MQIFQTMSMENKISKGGIIGAVLALLASLFTHKQSDTTGKKVLKSGSLGILGYLIGHYAEKKVRSRK